jgi:hypothetical protein
MTYIYRRDVLEQLERHGVRPRSTTAPELVHAFINDLYRYELRVLRAQLIRGEFAKQEYFGRVVGVRSRYPLLSLKPWQWLEPSGAC